SFQDARLIDEFVCHLRSPQGIQGLVSTIANRAGLAVLSVHTHTMRHTFAHHVTQERILTERQLQFYLGHSSIVTTAKYGRTTGEDMRQAIEGRSLGYNG
ncbi:MAG: tyrosine-type recombinase/integrase, partial [Cyanobacteria bacterium REEB65]|nr:tyrosine-type recombinase/integrase [Cyanobacteria bacterium REEB65]